MVSRLLVCWLGMSGRPEGAILEFRAIRSWAGQVWASGPERAILESGLLAAGLGKSGQVDGNQQSCNLRLLAAGLGKWAAIIS